MKTQMKKMKASALTLGLFAAITGGLAFSSDAQAARLCGWSMKEQTVTPTAPRPAGGALSEGTEEGLSASDRNRLLDWALNTKLALEEIASKMAPLRMVEKKQMLVECIENIVIDSAPLSSETLLRYTLNRALKANEVIEDEAIRKNGSRFAAGTVDQQVRLLRESLTMALKYYQNDVMYINGKKTNANLRDLIAPEYAKFGVRFNALLLTLSNSIFDATAQYGILRKSTTWLSNDLAKDAKAEAYGRIAIILDNEFRGMDDPSTVRMSDSQAVIQSRQVKRALVEAKNAIASVDKALAPTENK